MVGIRKLFRISPFIHFKNSEIFLTLSQNPGRISEELQPQDRIIVIDEIQRLPELLNEVHRLIETRGIRFLLTGSSARKLRRCGINLLGGRARTKYLHPLTYKELNTQFGSVVGQGVFLICQQLASK